MKALSIAATGINAQQINLEVIANNIANINTTGFKRSRAEFSDLLYQVERNKGVPNTANQAIVPEGAHVGLGVQMSAVRNLHEQGSLAATSNKLDLAIIGQGWFQVETPAGETLYQLPRATAVAALRRHPRRHRGAPVAPHRPRAYGEPSGPRVWPRDRGHGPAHSARGRGSAP